MVSRRVVHIAVVFLILCGLGVASYWARMNVDVTVFGSEVKLSPSKYSVKMNASSVYTRNITVSTNSDKEITVTIKVLPGDYKTADIWGSDFIAFASPSEVTVSSGKSAKVTIIHYSEREGNYKVKVIAAR